MSDADVFILPGKCQICQSKKGTREESSDGGETERVCERKAPWTPPDIYGMLPPTWARQLGRAGGLCRSVH